MYYRLYIHLWLVCSVMLQNVAFASELKSPLLINSLQLKPQTSYQIPREFVGFIQAKQQTSLGSELNGKVKRILVDVGRNVTAGTPLLELDTDLLQTEKQQLFAQQQQFQAQLDLINTNLARQQTLQAKGFSAASEIDSLQSQRKALLANLSQLHATLAANRLKLTKSTIRAPYNGKISERFVSQGDVINIGTPTFTLLANDLTEAHIGVPAKYMTQILNQPSWQIRINNKLYPTQLLNPGASIDLNSRTVELRFALQAPLLTGELAYLTYQDHQQQNGYWIPLTALTEGLRGVWTVMAIVPKSDKNHQILEQRTVKVIFANGTDAYITGAIHPHEQIVADGLHRVVAGQEVETALQPKGKNNE
ncbi:TPA: efflux RND transporter periplasmic adaptor subunit [Photobacterium damselae]